MNSSIGLRFSALFLFLFVALGVQAQGFKAASERQIKKEKDPFTRMVKYFEGYYSNYEYLKPLGREQRAQDMIIRQIWKDRNEGDKAWFYLGWFKHDLHTIPLAQLIVCFDYQDETNALVQMYHIPEELQRENVWAEKKPYEAQTIEDFRKPEGCLHKMTFKTAYEEEEIKRYYIKAPEEFCEFPLGGQVAWAHFDLFIQPDRLRFFNTFYNKDKQVVINDNDVYFLRLNARTLNKKIKK